MNTIGMDTNRFAVGETATLESAVTGTAGSSRAALERTNLWRERFPVLRKPESRPEAAGCVHPFAAR